MSHEFTKNFLQKIEFYCTQMSVLILRTNMFTCCGHYSVKSQQLELVKESTTFSNAKSKHGKTIVLCLGAIDSSSTLKNHMDDIVLTKKAFLILSLSG